MRNALANVRSLARAVTDEVLVHVFPGATLVPDPAPSCPIGSKQHPAHEGMRICRGHFAELGRLLRQIEDDAAILSAAPSYAISYESTGGRGLASEQAPARLDVLAFTDLRTNLVPPTPRAERQARQAKRYGPWCLMCDHETCKDWRAGRDRDRYDDEQDAGSHHILSAAATLQSWADNVRDYRNLSRPATTMLTQDRDLLTRQLRWIAEQDWVTDFHDELRQLAGQLAAANGTADVAVGTCGTLLPDGSLCPGDVWHVVIKPGGKVSTSSTRPAGPHDEPGFRCGACRRVWTGTDAVRKRNDMWIDEQKRKSERTATAT